MPRLVIRIITALGPRVIISNDLPAQDAWAISNALAGKEIAAHITEDATPIPMAKLIKQRQKEEKAKAVKAVSNVTKLPVRKP